MIKMPGEQNLSKKNQRLLESSFGGICICINHHCKWKCCSQRMMSIRTFVMEIFFENSFKMDQSSPGFLESLRFSSHYAASPQQQMSHRNSSILRPYSELQQCMMILVTAQMRCSKCRGSLSVPDSVFKELSNTQHQCAESVVD